MGREEEPQSGLSKSVYERRLRSKVVPENNMSRGGCSKVRRHSSMFSTDGKEAKNKGRVEDVREGILPLTE